MLVVNSTLEKGYKMESCAPNIFQEAVSPIFGELDRFY